MDLHFIKNMLAQMAEVDFNTVPSLRFQAHLRRILVEQLGSRAGMSELLVERLVARMDVSLGTEELPDEFVEELAVTYAKLIVKMYDALAAADFRYPAEALLEAGPRLSLKLS